MFVCFMVDPEVFTVSHIWTVPYLSPDGRIMRIEPEVHVAGIGRTSGSVIDATKCEFHDPFVCPNVVREEMPCVEGIIGKDPELISKCLIKPFEQRLPIVKRVTEKQV